MLSCIRLILLVSTLALFADSALALELCGTGAIKVTDHSLYLRINGCWQEIPYQGRAEGALGNDVPKFAGRYKADFAFAVQNREGYESALLVKERIYRPAVVLKNGRRPDAEAAKRIVLERPAISNRCGTWTALRGRRNGDEPSVSVNEYNRYHAQVSGVVYPPDDLVGFHYRYPTGQTDCRATDDLNSGNRGQYVFQNLDVEDPPFFLSWVPKFISIAAADNKTYTSLKESLGCFI